MLVALRMFTESSVSCLQTRGLASGSLGEDGRGRRTWPCPHCVRHLSCTFWRVAAVWGREKAERAAEGRLRDFSARVVVEAGKAIRSSLQGAWQRRQQLCSFARRFANTRPRRPARPGRVDYRAVRNHVRRRIRGEAASCSRRLRVDALVLRRRRLPPVFFFELAVILRRAGEQASDASRRSDGASALNGSPAASGYVSSITARVCQPSLDRSPSDSAPPTPHGSASGWVCWGYVADLVLNFLQHLALSPGDAEVADRDAAWRGNENCKRMHAPRIFLASRRHQFPAVCSAEVAVGWRVLIRQVAHPPRWELMVQLYACTDNKASKMLANKKNRIKAKICPRNAFYMLVLR